MRLRTIAAAALSISIAYYFGILRNVRADEYEYIKYYEVLKESFPSKSLDAL